MGTSCSGDDGTGVYLLRNSKMELTKYEVQMERLNNAGNHLVPEYVNLCTCAEM